ncbi:Plasmodium exported protein (PHISTb), unknown function [Plasmodium reichenowi]|uniref:Plasmodium RESA N-terminal domain-containing protein n=1 Tax=Plasmodium reichenowi TaxID=5854 RepID=A0A2P9D4V1_PLARE|nr:Plasmodium exported protein (PHISTb), unknown function [Plasmodium reichenowi]
MGKPFLLKCLLYKHNIIPMIGLVYITVLTVGIFYQGDFCSFNSEFNKRCSRKLYYETSSPEPDQVEEDGKLHKVIDVVNNEEGSSLNRITKEESENSHNDIFKNYKTLFNNVRQYEENNFSDKSGSMVFNEKDNQLDKRIELLNSDNDNIKENMLNIWIEVIRNERRKYENLKVAIYRFYNDLKSVHKVPKSFAEGKWQECNEIILIGGQNMETYMDNIFYDWIDNNNLNINEFKLIVDANRFAWKKLNESVKNSCEGILNKTFEAKLKGKELRSKFIVDMYKQVFDNAIKRCVLKNKGLNRKMNGSNYVDNIRNAPFIDIDASDDLHEEIESHNFKGNDKYDEDEEEDEEDEEDEEEDEEEEEGIEEHDINYKDSIDDLEYEQEEYNDKNEKQTNPIYHKFGLGKPENYLNYLEMNLLNLKKIFDDLDINFSDIKMDFSDIDNKISDVDINFDDLNVDLTDLENDFSELPIDFNDLPINFNDLSINFNNLPIEFNDIPIDFKDISIDFNHLPVDFTNLNIDYSGLEVDYINPGANMSKETVQHEEPNINDSINDLFIDSYNDLSYSDTDYEGTEHETDLSEQESII